MIESVKGIDSIGSRRRYLKEMGTTVCLAAALFADCSYAFCQAQRVRVEPGLGSRACQAHRTDFRDRFQGEHSIRKSTLV